MEHVLLISHGNISVNTNLELTQELLQRIYDLDDGIIVIRFKDNAFERLSTHKWRKEGGWDNSLPWQIKWNKIWNKIKEN